MGKTPRKYNDQFKRQAVQLAKSVGPTEAARKLGVSDANVHNWRKKFGDLASVSENEADELKRLRKENSDLKKANTILKAAAAFFSQDHLK